MLKLSKCSKLVKRRIPFNLKNIDTDKVDACTVYVENFPDTLTQRDIAKIFLRAGEIRNISLPRFGQTKQTGTDANMDTDESHNKVKGYCFIEFDSSEAADTAVSTFNNCIPEELTNADHQNYVGQETLSQFNVMKKSQW